MQTYKSETISPEDICNISNMGTYESRILSSEDISKITKETFRADIKHRIESGEKDFENMKFYFSHNEWNCATILDNIFKEIKQHINEEKIAKDFPFLLFNTEDRQKILLKIFCSSSENSKTAIRFDQYMDTFTKSFVFMFTRMYNDLFFENDNTYTLQNFIYDLITLSNSRNEKIVTAIKETFDLIPKALIGLFGLYATDKNLFCEKYLSAGFSNKKYSIDGIQNKVPRGYDAINSLTLCYQILRMFTKFNIAFENMCKTINETTDITIECRDLKLVRMVKESKINYNSLNAISKSIENAIPKSKILGTKNKDEMISPAIVCDQYLFSIAKFIENTLQPGCYYRQMFNYNTLQCAYNAIFEMMADTCSYGWMCRFSKNYLSHPILYKLETVKLLFNSSLETLHNCSYTASKSYISGAPKNGIKQCNQQASQTPSQSSSQSPSQVPSQTPSQTPLNPQPNSFHTRTNLSNNNGLTSDTKELYYMAFLLITSMKLLNLPPPNVVDIKSFMRTPNPNFIGIAHLNQLENASTPTLEKNFNEIAKCSKQFITKLLRGTKNDKTPKSKFESFVESCDVKVDVAGIKNMVIKDIAKDDILIGNISIDELLKSASVNVRESSPKFITYMMSICHMVILSIPSIKNSFNDNVKRLMIPHSKYSQDYRFESSWLKMNSNRIILPCSTSASLSENLYPIVLHWWNSEKMEMNYKKEIKETMRQYYVINKDTYFQPCEYNMSVTPKKVDTPRKIHRRSKSLKLFSANKIKKIIDKRKQRKQRSQQQSHQQNQCSNKIAEIRRKTFRRTKSLKRFNAIEIEKIKNDRQNQQVQQQVQQNHNNISDGSVNIAIDNVQPQQQIQQQPRNQQQNHQNWNQNRQNRNRNWNQNNQNQNWNRQNYHNRNQNQNRQNHQNQNQQQNRNHQNYQNRQNQNHQYSQNPRNQYRNRQNRQNYRNPQNRRYPQNPRNQQHVQTGGPQHE